MVRCGGWRTASTRCRPTSIGCRRANSVISTRSASRSDATSTSPGDGRRSRRSPPSSNSNARRPHSSGSRCAITTAVLRTRRSTGRGPISTCRSAIAPAGRSVWSVHPGAPHRERSASTSRSSSRASDGFVGDFFTSAEQAFVGGLHPPDRRDEVINLIWSAKEAALKVQQVGLRADTRTVDGRDRAGPALGRLGGDDRDRNQRSNARMVAPRWCVPAHDRLRSAV